MNKLAKRAWFALALAGVLLLGMGVIVVRYFIDSPDWVTFQNSPHVYTDGVMNSGKIVDRSGTVVLDATNGKSYADSASLRRSMLHLLGDREGNITPFLLQEYGSELVGFDRINGTYSTGKREGRMMLTVSADVQRTALAALDGRKGTVGVYNYKTGEILCAVSSPTYDPDDVPDVEGNPETYEGVYVNRFLHATYTPGSVFKLVTAAAALDEIPDIGSRTFTCEGSAVIGGETIQCNGVHGTLNFEEALAHSCNVVFGEIAAELGPKTLMRYAEQVGVTRRYSFDGTTTAAGSFDVSNAAESELAWAGIGQYTDQINPCQYMTYMGAIANGVFAHQIGHAGGGDHTQQVNVCANAAQTGSQGAFQHIAGNTGIFANQNTGTVAVQTGQLCGSCAADLQGQFTSQVFARHTADTIGTKQFTHIVKSFPSIKVNTLNYNE